MRELKRALPEDFVDKTTDEAVKPIKSSTVPEFKNKGNKIQSKQQHHGKNQRSNKCNEKR